MPQLSILIPSIPSRFEKSVTLYNRIKDMAEDMDIEVLMFTDNKKRTIGEKRDALKNISLGKYFMFIDDDDDLVELKDLYEATFHDVDVISFISECRNADSSTYKVYFGLGYEVEHNQKDGIYSDCRRPPFHVCAWHNKYKHYTYPTVNYAEDWGWLKQVLPLAKTEIHIPKIIHKYNFDINLSEASTESNSEWTNPNEP